MPENKAQYLTGDATELAPIDELNALDAQLQQLRLRQADATEAGVYDQLQAEINAIEKTISLAKARRRREAEAAAEAQRQEAIEQHHAALKKLGELKRTMEKQDQAVFAALEEYVTLYQAHWETSIDAAELADQLQKDAAELGLEPVNKLPVTIAGMQVGGASKLHHAAQILSQYLNAWGFIQDARKNKQPAPDKPGLDWFAKGDGQFWPKP